MEVNETTNTHSVSPKLTAHRDFRLRILDKVTWTVVGGILLFLPFDWLAFDICSTPRYALDEFTVFFASTGVLDVFLGTHFEQAVGFIWTT